jgi:hypothetical protein
MKLHLYFIGILLFLIILMVMTKWQKEGFITSRVYDYCSKYDDCMSCSSASGCSWCPSSKVCLTSTTLKSTDKDCNQNNTISSSFRCKSAEGVEPPTLPEAIASNDVMYDFSLYKNRITDKIPPPNLYMAGEVKVSSADLLSNMNDVRNDIQNYQTNLPTIISSAVEGQIKPMVKGILSENYYIQGFEDMNSKNNENKCKSYKSCRDCLQNKDCGWDPRSYSCNKQTPNNLWQITQPSRCTLTPKTQKLMVTRPGGNV